MNWNIELAYSWGLVFICLIVGAVYAGILYYRNAQNLHTDKNLIKWILPAARFILVSLLAFFLLSPVFKYVGYNTEKPIIAMIVDDSKSMASSDSASALQNLKDEVESIQKGLQSKFDVQVIKLGQNVATSSKSELTLSETRTNLSSGLNYMANNYVNENVAAAIMMSDGIYNQGPNPSNVLTRLKLPIHTVRYGDTTKQADLLVKEVQHNSIAYLGNQFPFRIAISAFGLPQRVTTLSVYHNGTLKLQETVSINEQEFFKELEYLLVADKLGNNRVDVILSEVEGESNTVNNNYSFYIDVVDSRKKIALWADAPHPDLGALKSVIEGNDNYDLSFSYRSYETRTDWDLVILHNWFQNAEQLNIYEALHSKKVAVLVILGSDFNAKYFNSSSSSINFSGSGLSYNSSLPALNNEFEYFELETEVETQLLKWPPLNTPFGKFTGFKPSDVVLYQQIGSVKTTEPLILVKEEANGNRLGLISGTGMWQWRLQDYAQNGSHYAIAQLTNKLVQYLSLKQDKKLLSVKPAQLEYEQGEIVNLLGEAYNQSLEALADQEIAVRLRNEANKEFKHIMTSSGERYKLKLKGLNPGVYTYNASVNIGGEVLKDNGYFIVLGQEIEMARTHADHDLLKYLSLETGGKSYEAGASEQLVKDLTTNDAYKSAIVEDFRVQDLIELKWVFWLLVALLSLEWFIRKWVGGY